MGLFNTEPETQPRSVPFSLEGMLETLQEFMVKSKGLLCVDNVLHPVLFSFAENSVTPHEIDMNSEEAKNETRDLMRTLARTPGVIGVALLLDAYLYSCADANSIPKDLRGIKGTYEAITCIFHTSTESYIRQMPYKYSEEKNQYWFSDSGWVKSNRMSPATTRFENPFLATEMGS